MVAVSVGEAKSEEILRQAIAMGSDRAILVNAPADIQPLAEAKLLQKIVEKENPNLVITGKLSIDDDMNQTGQILATLMGWGQATFASEVSIEGDSAKVVREVDGGLLSMKVKLPAVITTDLRLNEPRYVKLPDIMKARSKPLDKIEASELGVDINNRFEVIKVEAPQQRQAGIKVENVDDLINELKQKQVL